MISIKVKKKNSEVSWFTNTPHSATVGISRAPAVSHLLLN